MSSQHQNYMEQLLLNIQYELMDIDHLQATQFIKNLMCQSTHGIQPTILNYIREAIHQFQSERAIIKYIKIIDKLIKYQHFLPALQNVISDIYCDLFMFLLIQKCHNQIEQIKILRKYWVGSIHPYVLNQMKEIILHRNHIDIDSGFKPEKIARIREYYESKLKMNAEALNQHLPYMGTTLEINKYAPSYQNFNNNINLHPITRYNVQPIKSNPVYNQNANYNVGFNNPNAYHPGVYQQYNPIQPNHQQQQNNMQQQNNLQQMNLQQVNTTQQMNLMQGNVQQGGNMKMGGVGYVDRQSQGNNQVDRHHYHSKPKSVVVSQRSSSQRMQLQEDTKRKRMASQQTRAAATPTPNSGCSVKEGSVQGSFLQEDLQSKPRKVIHRDEVMIDHKYMLLKLKRLSGFSCKQCGLQFISDENLSIHRHQHIKQKLTKNEKSSRLVKTPHQLSSSEDWINDKQQKHFQFDQFCTPVPQSFIGQILCNFCCSQLNLQFRNNQWVYSNATQVHLESKTFIMHKSCQVVLENSKEDEENDH